MSAPAAEDSSSTVSQAWHLLRTVLEGYSLHGQDFEQCTLFISLEEEMVRCATITNMWAPATSVAGCCGFGNSMAGKSVLVWKKCLEGSEGKEENQENF